MHPRRVRGGVKLAGGEVAGPALWAAQRWLRLVEAVASGAFLAEGLEYARLGQAKRMTVGPGSAEASIQGRADRPYQTVLSLPRLTEPQWELALAAMSEGAVYAAKLLAGELPANIEDVFAPHALRLFPAEAADVAVSCTCSDHRLAAAQPPPPAQPDPAQPAQPDPRWCKHACCLAYLLAQRLATEPFLIFLLRGLDAKDLLERLRERRLSAGPGERTPAYVQHVPGVADLPAKTLEESVVGFWDAGPGLDQLDLPLEKPRLSHPLLRRMGPSPFTNAPFPIVGLLASCYDTISEHTLKRATSDDATPPPPQPNGENGHAEEDA